MATTTENPPRETTAPGPMLAADGTPIPDATVVLIAMGDGGPEAYRSTHLADAGGIWTSPALAPGEYRVAAYGGTTTLIDFRRIAGTGSLLDDLERGARELVFEPHLPDFLAALEQDTGGNGDENAQQQRRSGQTQMLQGPPSQGGPIGQEVSRERASPGGDGAHRRGSHQPELLQGFLGQGFRLLEFALAQRDHLHVEERFNNEMSLPNRMHKRQLLCE